MTTFSRKAINLITLLYTSLVPPYFKRRWSKFIMRKWQSYDQRVLKFICTFESWEHFLPQLIKFLQQMERWGYPFFEINEINSEAHSRGILSATNNDMENEAPQSCYIFASRQKLTEQIFIRAAGNRFQNRFVDGVRQSFKAVFFNGRTVLR